MRFTHMSNLTFDKLNWLEFQLFISRCSCSLLHLYSLSIKHDNFQAEELSKALNNIYFTSTSDILSEIKYLHNTSQKFIKMVVLKCVFVVLLFSVCSGEDLKLIQRLPKNPLQKYTSFASVMILHFKIPVDASKAVFVFKVKDSPTSFFVRNCDARNISLFMTPGTFPVVNPDGIPFPTTFLNESRPKSTEIIILNNDKQHFKNFSAPIPGDWFAAAFISWTDPKNDKIEQQGLSSECDANLHAELFSVAQGDVPILTASMVRVVLTSERVLYKFFIPERVDHILVSVSVNKGCSKCGEVFVTVQESRFPTANSYVERIKIGAKSGNESLFFWVNGNKWYYLEIRYGEKGLSVGDTDLFVLLKLFSERVEKTESNVTALYFKSSQQKTILLPRKPLQNLVSYKQYNLMRISSAEDFTFEYDFQPIGNETVPLFVNVTNKQMTVLKFTVYDIIDIGGTLTLGFAIKPGSNDKTNATIIACMNRRAKEIPTFPDQCVNNHVSYNSSVILNETSGSLKLIHVPFPSPGTWFVTIRAFYPSCVPCKCPEKCHERFLICLKVCETSLSDDCIEDCRSQTVSLEICKGCDCDGSCKRNNEAEKNVSMIVSISSHPCVNGKCGKHGRCNHYFAGGFIYSACQCFGGYRGWDCSDGKNASSEAEILLSIFFLTLSNLLFILSIFFAYRRTYYTEAVVFFFTMFFSTFYHACDSEEDYGYCMFRLGVLQFCDFYCGLMSIWVTLVAMAHMSPRITSICHICGAILLAFGTIFNKQALWVFLMPAISGVVLIGISWGLWCRKTKKMFPAKKYLIRFMPIGTFLVLIGLISFAFLQTKDNYWLVHSIWHAIMAISVVFLLPSQGNFIPKS